MGWKDKVASKVWGAIKDTKKSNWVKDKAGTITGVKPMSGKIPWYIGAGGKDPAKRAATVKTWKRVSTDEAIEKAEKGIKGGKKKLKDLEATGWTKEFKDYKGKGTGRYHRKQMD